MNTIYKFSVIILSTLLLFSCEKGLEYEEVPESIYEDVDLQGNICTVEARELFQDQIYAVNWERWVDNYINTQTIGNYQGDGKTYENKTSTPITILGQTLNPGESMVVKNEIVIVDDPTAPEGELYKLYIFADSECTYSTPNKGYLFDASKFTGEFTFIDPEDGRSQQVRMPVRKNEVIVALLLSQEYNCYVTNIDGAPQLGVPGDFTAPRKYLVTNNSRRPDGKPSRQRMYEVNIQFLP